LRIKAEQVIAGTARPWTHHYGEVMTRDLWTRIVFVYLAFQSAQIGLWALLAPQSFYDGFPGFGRSWVSVDGPFNEHLIRDVGALNIALVVLFVAAAITRRPTMVLTAAIAALAWGTPHLIYHLANFDTLSGFDAAASIGGLAVFVLLPLSTLPAARSGSAPA
jgi:hypothetical protein